MLFSIQPIKELIESEPAKSTVAKNKIYKQRGTFYLDHGQTPILCETVDADASVEQVLSAFQKAPAVAVLEKNGVVSGSITAPQLMECLYAAYQHLQAFYQTVIQTTDASVTVIDREKRVRTWTKGAERIFSLTEAEVLGQPITQFFEPNKLEILHTLYEGKRINSHFHQPRADLFVLINSNPVLYNNRIIGAVVSETDVTNQVMLNDKLFTMSTEVHRLEQEVAKYKHSTDPFQAIKGNSASLQQTVQLAKKVCSVKSTVLILGESGVGKEVFAKAIHEASESPDAPFISINCGAIPASLFESELFGYERGAFSGADHKGKKGKIELAKGGTLFLDEAGEMPLDMQVKLLRVLQERTYYRVGGEKECKADFRLLAATNQDLPALIKKGEFREDLYYRLNVVSLHIPPLRERKEDIVELMHHFLNEFSVRYQRPIQQLSPEVMQALFQHDWPGNIRELRNVMERLVVFATDGVIKKEYLPFYESTHLQEQAADRTEEIDETILPLQYEMERHEKKVLERALRLSNGNKLECAEKLGITRATLYNRLKRLGMN